jgi:glycosyltransferase involved in cell wall biosynthesis
MNIRMLRWKLGMKRFQLWSFLPNVGEYVGTLGEAFSVYYCTDEWSKFTYVDGKEIAAAENRLIRKVDAVFATAQSLVDNRIGANPNTFLARHGVSFDLFARALRDETPIPDDVKAIDQPIVGFYGTLQDWIDFELIEFLASRHPEWAIVLIGDILVDVSRVKKYPNVHLLGKREHGLLPNYCKAFSVGLIPYILNERILHVNPIKLREYLSAGLPVVSSALPEVKLYGDYCVAAKTPEEFEKAIADAIRSDSPAMRAQRSAAMVRESWRCRVSDLLGHIQDVRKQKLAKSAGQ